MAIKKKKVITIEGLALMIGAGFAQQDKRFEKIEGELGEVKNDLSSLQETNSMEHQEIKTHLNNMAYRFELNELGRRVSVLEKKVK